MGEKKEKDKTSGNAFELQHKESQRRGASVSPTNPALGVTHFSRNPHAWVTNSCGAARSSQLLTQHGGHMWGPAAPGGDCVFMYKQLFSNRDLQRLLLSLFSDMFLYSSRESVTSEKTSGGLGLSSSRPHQAFYEQMYSSGQEVDLWGRSFPSLQRKGLH